MTTDTRDSSEVVLPGPGHVDTGGEEGLSADVALRLEPTAREPFTDTVAILHLDAREGDTPDVSVAIELTAADLVALRERIAALEA